MVKNENRPVCRKEGGGKEEALHTCIHTFECVSTVYANRGHNQSFASTKINVRDGEHVDFEVVILLPFPFPPVESNHFFRSKVARSKSSGKESEKVKIGAVEHVLAAFHESLRISNIFSLKMRDT